MTKTSTFGYYLPVDYPKLAAQWQGDNIAEIKTLMGFTDYPNLINIGYKSVELLDATQKVGSLLHISLEFRFRFRNSSRTMTLSPNTWLVLGTDLKVYKVSEERFSKRFIKASTPEPEEA